MYREPEERLKEGCRDVGLRACPGGSRDLLVVVALLPEVDNGHHMQTWSTAS